MASWEEFDAIFYFNKNFTYDGKVIEQILSNRRALDNRLFADRLLELLGVQAGTLLSVGFCIVSIANISNFQLPSYIPQFQILTFVPSSATLYPLSSMPTRNKA
jgi:hypothetical protein